MHPPASPQPAPALQFTFSPAAAPQWGALAAAWQELEKAASADPWMSHAWCAAWWQCLGQARSLRLLYAARGEHWAACLPLLVERQAGLRCLRGLGGDSQTRPLLVRPGAGPTELPPLGHALAADRDWDLLRLDSLPYAQAEALARSFHDAGLRVNMGAVLRQRYLPLSGDWPEIAALGNRATVTRLPRRERALRALGTLHCGVVSASAEAPAAFEECLKVEASGWKGRQGTAILCSPERTRFYRILVPLLAEQRRLHLLRLTCGGTLIAFYLTVANGMSLAGLTLGFDEAWKKHSPGALIVLFALRHAHQFGFREFNFLGGDDAFKADWTPCFRELTSLRVFNRTLRGRAAYALRRLRQARRLAAHHAPADAACPA